MTPPFSAPFLARCSVLVDAPRLAFFFSVTGLCALLGYTLGIRGIPWFHAGGLLLAPFLRTRVGALLAIVSMVTATARVVQGVFGFDQVFVAIGFLTRNLSGFPVFMGLLATVGSVAFVGAMVLVFRLLPARDMRIGLPWLTAIFFIVVGLKGAEEFTRTNIVGTSYGYLFGQARFADMYTDAYETPKPRVPFYPGSVGSDIAARRGANYWLIVVESMGQPIDAWALDALFEPLRDARLTTHYDVTRGAAPSVGSTIHGEIRELCNGRLVDGLLGSANRHCVPSLMRERGYRTVSVHANKTSVYGRDLWYPKIGFEQMLGSDTEPALNGDNMDRWGTLLDERTVQWTASTLLTQPHMFAYLLTVSTHLPADPLPGSRPIDGCGAEHPAPAQVCVHLANLRSVVADVARAAMELPNTVITVVGDHPPPFVIPSARSAFSPTDVPYFILVPRAVP